MVRNKQVKLEFFDRPDLLRFDFLTYNRQIFALKGKRVDRITKLKF
jgi:hypothetical protein